MNYDFKSRMDLSMEKMLKCATASDLKLFKSHAKSNNLQLKSLCWLFCGDRFTQCYRFDSLPDYVVDDGLVVKKMSNEMSVFEKTPGSSQKYEYWTYELSEKALEIKQKYGE